MYSEVFYEIIEDVIEKEGGYVNDPDDPGGETKYGISKKAFPKEDIKNLTIVRAKDIYYTKYWKPSKAYLIPDELQHIYFDMCVNFGIIGAGKVLQRAINGKYKAGLDLEADRLRAYRVLKFAEIVVKKPKQEKYWFGWYRRALDV
jgi:lysozyme family protein